MVSGWTKKTTSLLRKWRAAAAVLVVVVAAVFVAGCVATEEAAPQRILLDTDMDTDDLLALLYILKQDRSEFDLKAVTINVNAWSDAGHAVNHLYDILYMMGRDDIPVVVGGDDGISDSGTIHPNVGGYFPLIDQGMATFGGCRYRQAIPLEGGGRLDVNTNFGIRRGFLPQGHRRYIPLQQPTVQQVMIDTISAGPTTVILIGAHTNFAIFLMTNPHLKRNVEHMYIMGGGVRSKNPTGCCPKNATTSCTPEQCGDHGNLFTSYSTNPNAEFNIFGDPFAAYQVFHSGIPITLVPLDATNTIPINEKFFYEFKRHQSTYEAQYCFKSLKIARDTWFNDQFYTDGYTKEVSGPEAAHIRVATKAKLNVDKNSPLDREFFKSFLEALNVQENSGRFDFKAQFPFYGEILYRPNFKHKNIGRPVIVDMDMSPGDLISLIYLLKAPIEAIDVKGILVSGNGWANVASIDIIYDILHMMGRDDIPVGHGNTTALGTPSYGCDYVSIIPQGSGGLIDSDTLYGLARSLPRSPRRYTAENSVKHGAPRNTDHPELRQPLAFEVWHSIKEQLDPSEKITILTNGPLTNLANIVLSDRDASSLIEKVYVVGGHIRDENDSKGNVFTVPSNRYAEFNMFLDPLAAKTILESSLDIALIPLSSQRRAASFPSILEALMHADHTPESSFVHHLLLLLHDLQLKHRLYRHMDMFLGEVLGAVYLVEGLNIKPSLQLKPISIVTNSTASTDGQIVLDKQTAGSVKVLVDFSTEQYYSRLANSLGNKEQSAVIGSFEEQIAVWSRPPQKSGT
ncbi:hypothetical protein SEVIR_3G252700v4 [Setaria viridis]|uniref:Inosine/uridine-preferring nucleoside hydrolase domain-containing protein n=2 Tax=Setaria viridis TaxID=4556 RepID=A0A4U6VDF5_SETVI|nr:uncharacterized protein LOC117849551 isoform X5 [Setaria viridis]TKW27358.1 hypothetical protein SEVIR_3G252700v2 [Setaria viridis]